MRCNKQSLFLIWTYQSPKVFMFNNHSNKLRQLNIFDQSFLSFRAIALTFRTFLGGVAGRLCVSLGPLCQPKWWRSWSSNLSGELRMYRKMMRRGCCFEDCDATIVRDVLRVDVVYVIESVGRGRDVLQMKIDILNRFIDSATSWQIIKNPK